MLDVTAFTAWELELLNGLGFTQLRPEGAGELNEAQWRYLLHFALLAPSAHNTVPNTFRLDRASQSVAVLLSREYVLEASDPDGREALISTGCAIENLTLAAAQYGIAARWEVQSRLTWDMVTPAASEVVLGHVSLQGRVTAPEERDRQATLRSMVNRKTLRSEYDRNLPLPPLLASSLLAAVHSSESVRLYLFDLPAEKFAWGKLEELALKHKLEQPSFRSELGHWLLPNEDVRTPRGMRGQEFGLDARATRELIDQLCGKIPMTSDQLAFMARGGRLGLQSASAVCALAGTDELPATAIEVGRVFQRCALLACAHGFACAPHTAVCQVSHVRAISRATLMSGDLAPSVLMRFGQPLDRAAWSRAHSSRPALEALLPPARARADLDGAAPHTGAASFAPPAVQSG